MKATRQQFRLTGISPILGSAILDTSIFQDYMVDKKKGMTEEERARAQGDMELLPPQDYEAVTNKATGFYRDPSNGFPIIKDYQFMGFFKNAGLVLKDQEDVKLVAPASKVDKFLIVSPEWGTLYNAEGEVITKPDSILPRPLKAMTSQGPRTAVAISEQINTGWTTTITVTIIDNPGSPKSKALTMTTVRELLKYGQFSGLLQWRNAGYGRFTWEAVTEEESIVL